jgi:hypothetical protein
MGPSDSARHAEARDFGISNEAAQMQMDVYLKGAENERITKSLPSHSMDCSHAS